MKRTTGWVMSAGLVAMTTAVASAQSLPPRMAPPYAVVSDVGEPYPAPGYAQLVPPREIFSVLRENGYSPLGGLQQRGLVYTIAAINLDGDDGRLVIDARSGRILRFTPAWQMGDAMRNDIAVTYGPSSLLPPIKDMRRTLRPPAAIPQVASRSPTGSAPRGAPRAVAEPQPTAKAVSPPPQQSATVQQKPADAHAAIPAATAETKPAAGIQPTQPMPSAQGLDY